jgi:hypothetical protein
MSYQSYTQRQREERMNYWRSILAAWHNDGSTAKEYCKTNNLSLSQFKYWQYQLTLDARRNEESKQSPGLSFAEATIVSPSPNFEKPSPIELMTPDGYKFLLPPGFDESTLLRLLGLLRRLP